MKLTADNLRDLHDKALAQWYQTQPDQVDAGRELRSIVLAQHFCNFSLWNLEDEARRTDVEDGYIAEVKRGIDRWNQRRNDLIERIDESLLSKFPSPGHANAEQHSETAGMIIDRLSILALKIYHMDDNVRRARDRDLASECEQKVSVLRTQRDDLLGCLERLLADVRGGRRYFKVYRQFKAYNDPRLNPALQGKARQDR